MPITKTRFAPSPTGWIHLGNARTAVFNRLYGKVFLLRIEDTDAERSRTEFVAAILEDLHWLGLAWEEGPRSAEPNEYFQSQRTAIYEDYYARLEQDDLAYPCFCTPEELARSRRIQLSQGLPPKYSGKCAHLSREEIAQRLAQGLKPTLRFRVPPGQTVTFKDLIRGEQRFATDAIGDFIIRRADRTPAFFFCNAIDDALMGVTHVLRGEDHLPNTPRQLLILQALGLPQPRYGHISLILGEDGAPLSKRNGSMSLRELRERGYLPAAIVNFLARLGHVYPEDRLLSLQELALGFRLEKLSRAPARFDPKQLDFWQARAVRAADDATLEAWLGEAALRQVPPACRSQFLALVRSNWIFPEQAQAWADILFAPDYPVTETARLILAHTDPGFFRAALESARSHPQNYQEFLAALQAKCKVHGKQLFQPLRAALTGRLDGPELEPIYTLLGPQRLFDRLARFNPC
ncbi:glutamate--tRNA ligase [Methylothermus subterraneus]